MKWITIVVLLFSLNGYTMSGKEIIKKIKANYNQLNMVDLNIDYQLFKGHNSAEIIEAYQSVYRRKDKESYRQIHKTELINTTDYLLHVNHAEKRIIVSNSSRINAIDVDFKQSLKWCNNVTVTTKGKNRIIQLFIKSKTDIPFRTIVIEIDQNYWIKKITLNYATQMNFSKSYFTKEMGYPKMVITFNQLKKKWKDKEGLLDIKRFVEIEEKEIHLGEAYKNYELIDLRGKK